MPSQRLLTFVLLVVVCWLTGSFTIAAITRGQAAWDAGNRSVSCWFAYTDRATGSSVLVTGSARGLGTADPRTARQPA